MPDPLPHHVEISYRKHWTDYVKTGFFIIILLFVVFGMIRGKSATTAGLQDAYSNEQFLPLEGTPQKNATKIGLLYLNGMIVSDTSAFESVIPAGALITPGSVSLMLDDLKNQHADMKAVLIVLSSPGGEVGASDELAHMISAFKKDYPVYVYSPDTLASGGYYMAAPATKIYAHRHAEVGSIGVIAQVPNVKELAGKVGFTLETYATGALKDLGNPFRERTEEEKKVLQRMINQAFIDFKAVVSEGRGLSKDVVNSLATGEVWNGKEAVEKKLIDKALYQDQISDELKTELGVEELYYVQVVQPPTFLDELFSSFRSVKKEPILPLASQIMPFLKKGVYYYWY